MAPARSSSRRTAPSSATWTTTREPATTTARSSCCAGRATRAAATGSASTPGRGTPTSSPRLPTASGSGSRSGHEHLVRRRPRPPVPRVRRVLRDPSERPCLPPVQVDQPGPDRLRQEARRAPEAQEALVSPTHKVPCQACKGKGYLVLYVNEWAEHRERFQEFMNKLVDIVLRR